MNQDGLLNKFLGYLYNLFYDISDFFKEMGQHIILLSVIAAICIFSYIFFNSNPYNILNVVHSPFIIVTIFTISLIAIFLVNNDEETFYASSLLYSKFIS